ncbi:DUF1906 domain-containing protein [Nocardioides deserti]|uniref:DUF1906 domain-containing protein n=2 Tax=Nocardioides deserti TaxID=1588644 RepID=A0ABR6UD50_9ACTN|nr:DUF1906 domain-containing protein [Nocardioides deserti]
MADERVSDAQRFINSYNDSRIPKVEVDGKTSWTVMRALTRILQLHIGISTLSDTFGPATLSALKVSYPSIDSSNMVAGINRVIQSALYCKGYDGGNIDGVYNEKVQASVTQLKTNMGVDDVYPGSGLTPKVFKSLLTMDAYVPVMGGTEAVRGVQQWLNATYVDRENFYVIPCDGNFSRDVQKALMLAIQFQIGMSDSVANGVFGPGTQQGLKNNVLTIGSSGTWVQLFTAALLFNKRPEATFSPFFTDSVASVVNAFQSFTKLPVTGKGDFPTWASLLVSYGDNTREGTACDASTSVSDARLVSLIGAGYQTIGRYLCNVPGSSFNKMIQPGELARCAAGGLSVYPIYQTIGTNASYFSYSQGAAAAFNAIEWARFHGFRPGTRIYFAVDFDALDDEVTDYVLPYFRGVDGVMYEHAPLYQIGIYGARNVCSRVSVEGLASASFVLDMSSGYSGNLGYPLPANWAFDQISTVTVGAGSGSIEIDNNISSGRDLGQSSFLPIPVTTDLDVDFDMAWKPALLNDIRSYMETLGYGDTGSPGPEGALRLVSTPEAIDVLMSWDRIATSLARELKMRKSLMQAVLFQEMRHYSRQDVATDGAVIDYYAGTGLSPLSDASTGLGQIYAKTAIEARNHCISAGIIGGLVRDPSDESNLWAIWQRLHTEDTYNISTVPLVLIHAASRIGLSRPGLSQSDADTTATIARYNGTGPAAAGYGGVVFGYYSIFEIYNSIMRNA